MMNDEWATSESPTRHSSFVTFRYFPPSPAEQRIFVIQLLGSILSVVVVGVLAWRAEDAGLRAAMIGAGLGVLYLLARSAWELERKAQRAQNAQIEVMESGLQITDAKGATQNVNWSQIETTEVTGGRLLVRWSGEQKGELQIGAREIENGMELIRLIASRGRSTPAAKSNFIPLQPK